MVGTRLVVTAGPKDVRIARIVETEAYEGPTDLACHARAGLTDRTWPLFGPAGHAYVYLVYGMHELFNVVCRSGKGHAVLVRACEPISGLPEGTRLDGPGKVSKGLGITREDTGRAVLGGRLHLLPRATTPRIAVSARVGVGFSGDWALRPWRFFDAKSAHVSRPSKRAIGLGV